MDEDDIIEELNAGEQPSSFPNRTLGNNRGVPNALQNRSLNNARNNLPKRNAVVPKPKLNDGNPLIKNNNDNSSSSSSIINKLRKKNKPLSLFNRGKNKKSKNSDNSSENNNNVDNNNKTSVEDVIVKAKKTVLLIKIGIIAGIIIAIFVAILALISFFASIFGISEEFSGLGSTANLDSNAEHYKEATLYHEKLNKATEMYMESCNLYLDRSYIHGVLSYVWNFVDYNNDEKRKYQLMADNVDDVVELMVNKCVVDYEVNGMFYNNLKNSTFFKNYYGEALEYIDADTLLTEIFDYTKTGIDLARLNAGFINNNLKVNLRTCASSSDNRLINEGTHYSSTISFSDYLKGVIYGEITSYIKPEYIELLKAHTIIAASYALGNSNYKSGDEEIWVRNGNCWQVSCDIREGCTLCSDLNPKATTSLTGNNRSCNNTVRRVPPISDEQNRILDQVLEEVYGIVMINSKDGSIKVTQYRDKIETCGSVSECLGQIDAAKDAINGMNYKQILEKYYNNFVLSNMGEDSYAQNVEYNEGKYNGSVKFYAQTDYKSSFCGLKDATISGYGCGVTSMAMILSTFVDESYTPLVVNEEARSAGRGFCGYSGTNVGFFKYSAVKHGLGYQGVTKKGNLQVVLDALKSGNSLVIAHMGQGSFTSGGHYIILSAVRDDGKVHVYDPNHYVNVKRRKTGNGWYDFSEVIVKQSKSSGFHIITKR